MTKKIKGNLILLRYSLAEEDLLGVHPRIGEEIINKSVIPIQLICLKTITLEVGLIRTLIKINTSISRSSDENAYITKVLPEEKTKESCNPDGYISQLVLKDVMTNEPSPFPFHTAHPEGFRVPPPHRYIKLSGLPPSPGNCFPRNS